MKKTWVLILYILSFLLFLSPAEASSNNKFGIHIIQPKDLTKAAELVNSSGGDWGYITVVIQENDQDPKKWQAFFDLCREKHLIPLVRLATSLDQGVWQKPRLESIKTWADFLDSLNWPIKSRYVIIFNEPNHNKEWGGQAVPQEYAKILDEATRVFKQKNPDFFLLNAGFDQAAPNSKTTIEEVKFLKEVNWEVPDIFAKLDGWVSHSYPNHGFVGKPWESGRATVRGYNWELSILKTLGLSREIPVFITETGWPVKNCKLKTENCKFYDEETSSQYIKQTFENVWLPDSRIQAVTPFILNYPHPPFESFSWLDEKGRPFKQYEIVKDLTKTKGEPTQEESWEIMEFSPPHFLPSNFTYYGKITLENTGQSIWGEKPFRLKPQVSEIKLSDLIPPEGIQVKPGERWTFNYRLETSEKAGDFDFSWEGLPKNKIKVFEAWKLGREKTSILNLVLQKLLLFWYNLP